MSDTTPTVTLDIHSTGGIAPFQAEGYIRITDNNVTRHYGFYYRDRHGYARLGVSPITTLDDNGNPTVHDPFADNKHEPLDPNIPYGGQDPYWIAEIETEEFAGHDNFLDNLTGLFDELTPNDYLFTFSGYATTYVRERDADNNLIAHDVTVDTTTTTHYYGWGQTPAEALHELSTPSTWLAEQGVSIHLQQEAIRLAEISPLPTDDPIQMRDYDSTVMPTGVTREIIIDALRDFDARGPERLQAVREFLGIDDQSTD